MEEIILEIGEKICPNCGIPHKNRGICCCRSCGYEYRKKKNIIWKTCPVCGKSFSTDIGRINQGRGKHCSPECARVTYNLNSEERAKKISVVNKGRVKGPEWRAKLALASTGQIHTEEHNRKIKESTIKTYQEHPEILLKTVKYGPDNGMFNGYSSYGDYSKEFNNQRKEDCRSKYDYKCVVCGTTKFGKGRKLDIHHIDYNKLNSEMNNLYPLCIKCHNLTKIPNDKIKNSWYEWFTMMKWEEELGLR